MLLAFLLLQATSASITGFILDPDGRPVANAPVTLSDPARASVRTATTDGSGFYQITNLPPATYRIAAHAPGLEQAEPSEVKITAGTPVRVDLTVGLAGVKQRVDVIAEAGTTLSQTLMRSLPLNRRDFLQLALLAPGVLPPTQDSELSSRGSVAMHAGGAREEFNQFLLDGVDNNDPYNNRYLLQPPIETIQEFRVEANSYRAEYGRSAGGQINIITQRGSNAWHGEGYDYFRNRHLDTRNFFDGADRNQFVRNQYGLAGGGALQRDSTFIYGSFSGLEERRGLTRLATVPSLDQRGGLALGAADPFTRQPFPGGRIPASRISPVALKVMNLFPAPNLAGAAGNYLAQPVLSDSSKQWSLRLDRKALVLRYSYGAQDLAEPYAQESTAIPGFGDVVANTAHNAMIEHTEIATPALVNAIRAGFSRSYRGVLPENYRTDAGKAWGVNWLNLAPRDFGYPLVNVAGFSTAGDATQIPILRYTNTYQLSDVLSYARGNHLFKAGIEARKLEANALLDYFARGSLTFSGALSGSGIGDLLLGLPALGLQAKFDNPQTMRSTLTQVFAQDDWKLSPRLTINAGLRYEYNTPVSDPTGRARTVTRPDRDNFAPRIGVAVALKERWVLRAGYGIYYDAGMFVLNSSQYFNPPLFNLAVYFPTAARFLTLDNPFPANSPASKPTLNLLSPDAGTPYLQHWSLGLQRGDFSVFYVGSKGTDLIRSRDRNQPRPAAGDVNSRRPDQTAAGVFHIETGGNSSYQSLQLSYNHRFAKYVTLVSSYTAGKSIDDTSAFLGTKADKNFPQDSLNFRAERAVSSYDLRQRLVVAPVVAIPRLRRTEFRALVTAQSGAPLTPILRFDNSNTGNSGGVFGSDRPNLVGNPVLDGRSANLWFNPQAFAVPPKYQFGNAGRNIVRGPGLVNVDVSVMKAFAIREGWRVESSAEAFNLWNHTQLDLPERYADESATFGRIFSAKRGRQAQFSLRLAF